MFLPSLSHVRGCHDRAARLAIETAIKHQLTVGQLDNLRLGCVVPGPGCDRPILSMVVTVNESRMWKSIGLFVFGVWRILILSRKNDRPVGHRDPFAGTLKKE